MDVQQLFKILKKEAECPLCLDTVQNPKTLPCLHSFCLECLDKLANFARRQLQTSIKCPVCQASFSIPDTNTFANFPSSFHLNRLVDVLALHDSTVQVQKCNSCDENNLATSYCFVCQNFMCESCLQSHQRLKATRDHRHVLINKLQAQDVQELIERPIMCSQKYHKDQPLEFYCQDCKVLICHKCSVVSHNRHNMTDTHQAAQEQKIQMAEAVAKLKAEVLLYENEIKKQTELKDKNVTDIMNAEKKMTDSVEEWIRDLREHEKKMKQKFREIYEAEQKQHETRLENLELITTQLKSCVERGQGVLERNISAEILQTNHTILQRCDELINTRKSDRYKSPDLHYFVKKKFDTFDQIVVTKTDSSMCLPKFHYSEIGGGSNVVVVTRDSEELQCYQLETERQQGWQIHSDIHTTMSGSRAGEFAWISDIAVSDRTGTIAVADGDNKRIQLFSSDGKFQRQVKLDGKPYSVAFTDCGDLLTLVSGNNNKLRLYSEEGQFIKHINDKHLKKPQHLSIASEGVLIITDHASNEVKVLSPDGNDQLQSMTAPNCDKYPDCAVYHQNTFYVSYPEDHCIKVFDKTGVYIQDIGCKGSSYGQFDCPRGLVINKKNELIVCDATNRRLQLFTLSGKFWGTLQGGYYKHGSPWYAALNKNGNLIVAGPFENHIFVNSSEVFDKKRD
ncbi:PREDICTED: E3 ubiquitin-protein ligase TRIM71-like [Acropora digitifera]|uniref:E3 ubiquitin-protein ligase TRIM71-like n=1 Tax=Acropora digitifera TaxID=70779 RepID=UPI00077A8E16|nr:PREDICTED: E3 ubiquitin-protein ligase TRIM71-like [Acropora digitifera]